MLLSAAITTVVRASTAITTSANTRANCLCIVSLHLISVRSVFGGTSVLGPPYVCSVTVANQEFRVDERTEHRIARGAIQAPQSLCLCHRQAMSGHLDVFTP